MARNFVQGFGAKDGKEKAQDRDDKDNNFENTICLHLFVIILRRKKTKGGIMRWLYAQSVTHLRESLHKVIREFSH
jgi:hypothetical protein